MKTLGLALLVAIFSSYAPILLAENVVKEPVVVAVSAAVMDSFTGNFLWKKNYEQRQFPASATKVLTALLVIEAGHLDQFVTVDLADTKVEPSSLELKPGENYTRRELLYGLLLKSANDVAMTLARDNSGSVAAFAEKMNLRSAELGATDSHFTNPHGLHEKQHYTTAHDFLLISRAAMQQPFFREIVSKQSYDFHSPLGIIPLRNHNRLLERYPGCIGLKTGFTNPAQQVLVSSAQREGREFLAIVLHTNRPGIWEDSIKLLDFGFTTAQN